MLSYREIRRVKGDVRKVVFRLCPKLDVERKFRRADRSFRRFAMPARVRNKLKKKRSILAWKYAFNSQNEIFRLHSLTCMSSRRRFLFHCISITRAFPPLCFRPLSHNIDTKIVLVQSCRSHSAKSSEKFNECHLEVKKKHIRQGRGKQKTSNKCTYTYALAKDHFCRVGWGWMNE